MQKNIDKTLSLYFVYKNLYIFKNKTILFLIYRKFFLFLNKKFKILNIILSFRFLYKHITNDSFFLLEILQIFLQLETLIILLYKKEVQYLMLKTLYIVKKEFLPIAINTLSIHILFDRIKEIYQIKTLKMLYKIFKVYKPMTFVYINFLERLFLLLHDLYIMVIKFSLTTQYLYKNVVYIYLRKFPFLGIGFFCKSCYIKDLTNELLYLFKIIYKLPGVRCNYINVYVYMYYVSYIGYYIKFFLHDFKLYQSNINMIKLLSRFQCLGYCYTNYKQYFFLNQISSLVKFKLFLNSLFSYYKNCLNKKLIFLKIVLFLKSAFITVFVNKLKCYSKSLIFIILKKDFSKLIKSSMLR